MLGTVFVLCDCGGRWDAWAWAKWLGIFARAGILCQLIGQAVIFFLTCPAAIKSD